MSDVVPEYGDDIVEKTQPPRKVEKPFYVFGGDNFSSNDRPLGTLIPPEVILADCSP